MTVVGADALCSIAFVTSSEKTKTASSTFLHPTPATCLGGSDEPLPS
jgi:hypothetical protein